MKESTSGSIYVLIDRGNELVKIGFSTQVNKRMGTHWRSNPKLEIWGVFPQMTLGHEQLLHSILGKYRFEDEEEFYILSDELLKLVSTTLYNWHMARTL